MRYLNGRELKELFDELDALGKRDFFNLICKEYDPMQIIKMLSNYLNNDELAELIKYLSKDLKSDEEWQMLVKELNQN